MIRSTIAGALRRLDAPRRRRRAAGGLLLGSLGLLGGVWLVLPSPESPTPIVREEPAGTTTSALLSGPDHLVLPLPDVDGVRVETLLRHRRDDVEVLEATVVNTDHVTAELAHDVPGATRLVLTSTAVHQCDRYAGSVIVTSRHPTARRDHLFIDVRFADCEGVTAVPAAPPSVNDTSRTWGDDGRAPWYRPPRPDPRPRPEAPEPTTSEPTEEPTTGTEPTSEPTDASSPTPRPTTEPTGQPTSEPTSGAGDDNGGDATDSGDTASESTDTGGTAGSSSTESPDG